MLRAKVTASRHKASRIAGSRFGAGAISITFWCRRWTEQSRSNRCTTSPVASARLWTSMCRARSTARSRKTVGSPKAPSASRMAARRAADRSPGASTRRIPRPPPPEVLEMAGNKVSALRAAWQAGIPILPSSEPSADVEVLLASAADIGFPLFVQAVAGGGGRGLRRVEAPGDLSAALRAAMREADGAFGDPTVFLERAVLRPRHIEVQILADATGEVVHLFERDCSVQRRHQKVIEIAPAPNLDPAIRDALCRDAVTFARSIGYVNAGTVEFLVDTVGERAGEHVFIEMNPRIQVEHTVTEEVTDVDLVSAQIRIAAGETLADLGISQDTVRVNGAALQCRITTEDPSNGFRPD